MKTKRIENNRYYKYVYDTFEQPQLSSDGTIGGEAFAVYATTNGGSPNYGRGSAWGACYPNTGSYNTYSKGGAPSTWYTVYTPKLTVITQFSFYAAWGNYGDSYMWVTLEASIDNSNWTTLYPRSYLHEGSVQLTLQNTNPYKYYKLTLNTTGGGNHDGLNLSSVRLYGDEKTTTKGTSSDYDFMVEAGDYYTPKIFIERKYYKYIDTGEPNATIVGSPTINNGIVSNFNNGNYLTYLKGIPNITSFEQIMKIKTANVTTLQCFSAGSAYRGLGTLQLTTTSKIRAWISSDGTSNDILNGTESSLSLQANTDYWIKYYWNGTIYNIDISTDGNIYTNYLSTNNSKKPCFNGFLGFGTDTGDSNNNPFLGSIDFTRSYIKLNNTEWWHGTIIQVQESTGQDYDFYKDINKYYALKSWEKGQYYGN